MSRYYVRINGTGNAWPVPLGTDHPFYDLNDPEQLANASFSIIKSSGDIKSRIEWEVLVDAGHGIVQYLLRHGNRLPEAVVLTHAHLDHTLSMDWIVQSFYRYHNKQKKLPVYASRPGWEFVSSSFPQLPPLSNFRELKPGEKKPVEGIPELSLVPLPVYHGEKAVGPLMLVFELSIPEREPVKILFSGDLLCPLLRRADYRWLQNTELAFLDANNRFPYTASNHWSICSEGPDGEVESKYLRSYREQLSCSQLLATHLPIHRDETIHGYFDEFLAYCDENIPFSVFEFCDRIKPGKALLVHYSGMEDRNHHKNDILNTVQLENWANAQAERRSIETGFHVAAPGTTFEIS